MRHARRNGRVQLDSSPVRCNRFSKHSAESEHLNQAGERLRFCRMMLQSFEKPTHRLIRTAKIHLQECVELVSGGQIGIERKCALKHSFSQLRYNGAAVREFIEEPATPAQPCPSRRKVRILRQTGPVQISREKHRLERSLRGQLPSTHKFFVSLPPDARFSRDGQFKSISVLGNGPNRIAANNLPKANDQVCEISLTYVYIGPECFTQLLLGNHVLCPSNQANQSVERFWLKSNRGSTSLE